ncbi:YkvA family protein [[Clostridium] fimetarium]|uniref:DUF1232 domain-containing protein n=1 Tax=[Clostridium] fimetarium TaxID=99656 RepID=A0A1I0MFJ4_9FIRM|nr:YkvA family protein [[Clostridium] fimetarium]SEV86888.1 Protein of unknown function [[Clostridium] fimetarium]
MHEKKNFKERAKNLIKDIKVIYVALKHPQTPWYAKALAAMTVGYALSPIDLIPDFIPVLGYLDDMIILPAMIALTIKLIPKDVFEQCRAESEKLWTVGKTKKWYYAIPIIIIWIMIILFIIKLIIR